jgi:RNA polymerase sigma factor (sigma-70 family)
MPKAYRVVAKLKNNRLWCAIKREFPDVRNQADAARALGETPSDLGGLLNMTRWPSGQRGWWAIATRVATRLRETPEYLFDADLYGVKPETLDVEIDRPALESAGFLALSGGPDEYIERREDEELFDTSVSEAIATLNEREAQILRLRFGIGGAVEHTLEEVGQLFAVTPERIRQVEAKALRKLRHPRWCSLRELVYG